MSDELLQRLIDAMDEGPTKTSIHVVPTGSQTLSIEGRGSVVNISEGAFAGLLRETLQLDDDQIAQGIADLATRPGVFFGCPIISDLPRRG